MYQHMLIPTDGSERSAAAAHAVELAKALGAKVMGITVSAPFPVITADPAVVTSVPERYEAEAEAAGRDRLKVVEEAAQGLGVPYEGVHVFQRPPV